MNLSLIFSFVLYLAIIMGIGLLATVASTRATSTQRMTGQGSINWWVTAISAHAADMSDWLFMGLPAAIYLGGMVNAWVAIGLVMGMFCAWQFLAPALVASAQRYNTTTLISFFEVKYQERSARLSIVSAMIMAFFFTVYIAAGIKGVGYLLSTTFGLPTALGGLITLSVTLGYTLLGGFIAAAWVDFFQGIFLLAALLITTISAAVSAGGFSAISHAVAHAGVSLSLFPQGGSVVSILFGPLAWGLGYFGMPHVLSKFMGARDVRSLHRSKYVGVAWQIVALSSAVCVGLVARAFFVDTLANPELLFVKITLDLFPSFLAGLILCGILSATLSTMNAQMIVFAGIIAHDLYAQVYNSNATKKAVMIVFRSSIVAVACLAFAISWFDHGTIFNLVQFAWGGLGASFGPLALLALTNMRINRHGAFYGMLSGGVAAVVWKLFAAEYANLSYINELVPGFVAGTVITVMVSYLTNRFIPGQLEQ